jgi:hypothetical protein
VLDREGNEDSLPFLSRHAFAAKGNVFDFEFNGAHQLTIAQPFKAGMQMSNVSKSRQGRQAFSFVPNGTHADCDPHNPALKRWAIVLRHRVFDRGFEFFELHRFDQMRGKAGFEALADIGVHAKTTDRDSGDGEFRA